MSKAAAKDGQLPPGTTVHTNPWFAVRDRGGYFTIDYHQPQVVVLPTVGADQVVMVRVKRPVLADTPLEFPAGAVEAGEDSVAAGARELREETGIGVAERSRFRPLTSITGAPNRTRRPIDLWHVDLSRREYDDRAAHDDEVVEVVLYTADEIRQRVRDGDIHIALPLAVLAQWQALRGAWQ